MSSESHTTQARLLFRRQEHEFTSRGGALKRKLSAFVASARQDETSYPSPPMSSPPSPSRTQPELTLSGNRASVRTSIGYQEPVPAYRPEPAPVSRFISSTLSATAATYHPTIAPSTTALQYSYPLEPLQLAGVRFQQSAQSLQPALQSGTSAQPEAGTARPSVPTSQSAGQASARGARKAKTHVASACINCKRAHLSCDVQRPCSRCVSTGKQDTCFDVQHKKRGRPRLREEGEFKVDPARVPQPEVHTGPSQTPSRPIAGARHRRGESFRSLLSQTSDDSPVWSAHTPSQPSSAVLQSPFSYQLPPTQTSNRPPYELATVLLDLDFVILRANQPFEQIVMRGQGLRGRHISDVVRPADSESFDSIRHGLRAEREAREPAHMPPILQPGQDPLQGVSEADVDRFTDSFSDRTYTWAQIQAGPTAQTFPARVRLAKAGSYFIVVTLPSFRPIEPSPWEPPVSSYGTPLALGPLLPVSDAYPPSRPPDLLPMPQPSFPPLQSTPISATRRPTMQRYPSQVYPPTSQQPTSHYQHSFQHLPAPQTPRLPIAEPPTDTTAFTPRSVPRETIRLTGTGELQLPPLGDTSTTSGRSRANTMDSLVQHASSDDGEGEESPRKRRRLGIDDVLHR